MNRAMRRAAEATRRPVASDFGQFSQTLRRQYPDLSSREIDRAWRRRLQWTGQEMIIQRPGEPWRPVLDTDFRICVSYNMAQFRVHASPGMIAELIKGWEAVIVSLKMADYRHNTRSIVIEMMLKNEFVNREMGPFLASAVLWLLASSENGGFLRDAEYYVGSERNVDCLITDEVEPSGFRWHNFRLMLS